MGINADEKDKSVPAENGPSQRIQIFENRLEFFQVCIGTLLIFIKAFSLDLKEIDADRFKSEIDRLGEKIKSENKTKKLQSVFEKHKKIISIYIKRLKKYLGTREKEFKGIIELLIEAMAVTDADNRVFNKKIFEQSEKIEQISLLNDIKKIKSALKQEIKQVRKAIKEKQLHDREHLKKLTRQVDSLSVELEKAKEESLTDGLTGIYNRLAFDRQMKKLEEKNVITKFPFSLLLFDIDNFKKINDTYGHPIGDRVILALIRKCRELTRKDDYLARFGGDEFAVIMPGASLRNATKKAKQLSKEVSKARYAVDSADESPALSFTISIGVSAYMKGDLSDNVIERADKALYAAKQSGKARVVNEKELE